MSGRRKRQENRSRACTPCTVV